MFNQSSRQRSSYQSKDFNTSNSISLSNVNSNKFVSSNNVQPTFMSQRPITNNFNNNSKQQQKSPSTTTNNKDNKSTARSPYRPKLIQHLIDSSEQDQNNTDSYADFDQQQQEEDNNDNDYSNNNRLTRNNKNNNDNLSSDNMGKSFFTNRTEQTGLSKATTNTNTNKLTKNNRDLFGDTNKSVVNNKFIPVISDSYSSMSHQFISQPNNNDKKVGLIKYDTLKLTQFDKKQTNKENQLYLKNRRQFQQQQKNNNVIENVSKSNMQTTKIKVKQQLYRSNLFQQQSNNNYNNNNYYQNEDNDNKNIVYCVDSLQEMRMNQQQQQQKYVKSNLIQRKLMANSTISLDKSQSYGLKSVSEIIKNNQQSLSLVQYNNNNNNNNIDEQLQLLDVSRTYQSKLQHINLQLKRAKDVIKTLTAKNTHLQKTIEMQTVQLQQLTNQQSSQIQQEQNRKQQLIAQNKTYQKVNQYLKLSIKQFMQDVQNIKMNPLLERSIEQFMTELLQIDTYTVNKKLGIKNELIKENRIQNQTDRQNSEEYEQKTLNRQQNKYKTTLPQTFNNNKNKPSSTTRSNAFMSNQINPLSSQSTSNKIKGTTVRVDLSSNKQNYPSNKENITPNKKGTTADEQFRLLQKSLHKLKNMQKQLNNNASPAHNPKLSTPLPKRQTTTLITTGLRTKYRFQKNYEDNNDDEQRSQYSLINRRQFSTLNDNSQMNVSNSNLDRSKSRRKKIFAPRNQL